MRDAKRYIDRVGEAIKKKLPEVVRDSKIITAPPNAKYTFAVPYMESPYFRPKRSGGQGGAASGGGSGEGSVEPHILVELTLEEVVELVFESLGLPMLPKGGDITEERLRVEGTTKDAPPQRLDLRRTALEHCKHGVWWPGVFRYRDLRAQREPITSAVVVFARDSSGSMDEERRYLVKTAALWTSLWIKRQYPYIAFRFLVHDTVSHEVDEELFFAAHAGGGTKVSSAWEHAEQILKDYPQERWNRYVFYFSDGENFDEDNARLADVLRRLVPALEMSAYGEVGDGIAGSLVVMMRKAGVRSGLIRSRDQVANWLREVFARENS